MSVLGAFAGAVNSGDPFPSSDLAKLSLTVVLYAPGSGFAHDICSWIRSRRGGLR
jgi:hypothetical protein